MKNRSPIIIAIAALGVFLAVFSIRRETPSGGGSSSSAAPSFVAVDARSGVRMSSDSLRGKVVFVNFWATWCPPCREEVPSIAALAQSLSGNSSFVMITLLYRDSAEAGLSYLQSNGHVFPVFTDPDGTAAQAFHVTGVPETYVIDKRGAIRRKVIGAADWNSAEEKAFITSLLSE